MFQQSHKNNGSPKNDSDLPGPKIRLNYEEMLQDQAHAFIEEVPVQMKRDEEEQLQAKTVESVHSVPVQLKEEEEEIQKKETPSEARQAETVSEDNSGIQLDNVVYHKISNKDVEVVSDKLSNKTNEKLRDDGKENNIDGFSKADYAARDFGLKYFTNLPNNHKDKDREHASYIFFRINSEGLKKYFYADPPSKGTRNKNRKPAMPKNRLDRENIIAYVHTHGLWHKKYDSRGPGKVKRRNKDFNNHFSYELYKGQGKGDVEFAKEKGIDGFLVDTNGKTWKYDRIQNEKDAKIYYENMLKQENVKLKKSGKKEMTLDEMVKNLDYDDRYIPKQVEAEKLEEKK